LYSQQARHEYFRSGRVVQHTLPCLFRDFRCNRVLAHPPCQIRDFDAFRCANTSYHVNFRVFKFSMCPGGLAHPTTLILGFSTWWIVQPMLSSQFLTCSGVPIPYRVDFRIFGVSRIYLGTLYINILILWLSVKNPWPVPIPVVRGLPVTCGIPHSGFPLGSLCTMCLGHLHLVWPLLTG